MTTGYLKSGKWHTVSSKAAIDVDCCECECPFVCTGTRPSICAFRLGTPWGNMTITNPAGASVPMVWAPGPGADECFIRFTENTLFYVTCNRLSSAAYSETKTCTNATMTSVQNMTITGHSDLVNLVGNVDVIFKITTVAGVSKLSASGQFGFSQGYPATLPGDNGSFSGTFSYTADFPTLPACNRSESYTQAVLSACDLSLGIDGAASAGGLLSTVAAEFVSSTEVTLGTCADMLNTLTWNFDYGAASVPFYYQNVAPTVQPFGACGVQQPFFGANLPDACFVGFRTFCSFSQPDYSLPQIPLGACSFELQLQAC